MDENTTQTPADDSNVVELHETQPTRLQSFVAKHPRGAKIVAITGGALAALGVVQTTRTVQANRRHLEQSADHAKEAIRELSTSVSPQDPEA